MENVEIVTAKVMTTSHSAHRILVVLSDGRVGEFRTTVDGERSMWTPLGNVIETTATSNE